MPTFLAVSNFPIQIGVLLYSASRCSFLASGCCHVNTSHFKKYTASLLLRLKVVEALELGARLATQGGQLAAYGVAAQTAAAAEAAGRDRWDCWTAQFNKHNNSSRILIHLHQDCTCACTLSCLSE